MKRHKTLQELFSFTGFRAQHKLTGKFGDPKIRVVTLSRIKKLQYALAVTLRANHITINQ